MDSESNDSRHTPSGFRMIGPERWDIFIVPSVGVSGGGEADFDFDEARRRILVSSRCAKGGPTAFEDTVYAAVRMLQADYCERMHPNQADEDEARTPAAPPPPAARTYPADALGIKVIMVNAPLMNADVRYAVRIIDDHTIQADSSLPRWFVRQAVIETRRELAEKLPAGELNALAADIDAAELKLDPPRPIHRGADGRFLCPHCGNPYKLWDRLLNHIVSRHPDDTGTRTAMCYNGPEIAVPFPAGIRPPHLPPAA